MSDFSSALIITLSILRFAAVSLIAFFLLEPMLKLVRQEVEKPVIVIGIDNSESMVMTADSAQARSLASDQIDALSLALGDDFEVRSYSFGETVNESPDVDFSDKETDISAFIQEIQNRYSNRNLGAVIMASDGLYNRGLNPVHQTRQFPAPIYNIALGDTTPQKDIVLREVRHNELAYLGNDFPVEVLIEARGFSGKSTTVNIQHNGNELASEVVRFENPTDQQALQFYIEATATGIQHYTITSAFQEGEFTADNNRRDIYIEVLDSKQKILMMANAPHPDIRALRQSIEANENYSVDFRLPGATIPDIEAYHLVILHGLPSTKHNLAATFQNMQAQSVPTWVVLTDQTNLNTLNDWNIGINISGTKGTTNDARSAFNGTFSLFNMDTEDGNYFGSLPPLQVPFGEYQLTAQGQVLMHQRIGSVKTEFPLWSFSDIDGWKNAVLSGEGIWRWRTMSYADKASHNTFNSLVHKTVQYLASRENKEFLRVSGARSFRENEDIVFRAEVYNPSYELYTDPDVQMVVTDSEGKNYEFNFSRTGNAYRLNAGRLPSGNYNYEVIAQTDSERYTANGSFSVVEVNTESVSITANHRLLYQISKSTGGEMLYPDDIGNLAEIIKNSNEIASVVYERKELADLINLRWIFYVLLALFAIEWFIRKRNGAY